jgi:hypothetical protein
MKKLLAVATAASLTMSSAANASKTVELVPVPSGDQTVRYEQGIPTIENATIRVMPVRQLDHGSIQFKVAVFNSGEQPFNFGTENVKFLDNGEAVDVYTREELEHKAKHRAMWSQIGYAMLAGAAAAAQNNNFSATTYTPRGVYHTTIYRPGLSDGQIATIAAGGGAIALSQIGLQKTLEQIGDETLQTTTVDPNTGYGGKVVVAKLKHAKPGDKLTLNVDIGGKVSTFTFTLKK